MGIFLPVIMEPTMTNQDKLAAARKAYAEICSEERKQRFLKCEPFDSLISKALKVISQDACWVGDPDLAEYATLTTKLFIISTGLAYTKVGMFLQSKGVPKIVCSMIAEMAVGATLSLPINDSWSVVSTTGSSFEFERLFETGINISANTERKEIIVDTAKIDEEFLEQSGGLKWNPMELPVQGTLQ